MSLKKNKIIQVYKDPKGCSQRNGPRGFLFKMATKEKGQNAWNNQVPHKGHNSTTHREQRKPFYSSNGLLFNMSCCLWRVQNVVLISLDSYLPSSFAIGDI